MISSLTALLVVFAAVFGSAAMMGLIAYLLNRIRQVESQMLGEAGPNQLAGQVSEIREDLLRVQEEMSALSERVEFTDRLLLRGDDPERPPRS